MYKKNSHCSYCGEAFPAGSSAPFTCARCKNTTFENPLPVAVVLVPLDNGLLGVKRAIDPGKGKLALPGGYINLGESWQEAGAREVREETGVTIDPEEIRQFRVRSAPDGTVLIFGLAREQFRSADLPPFPKSAEVSERVVIRGAGQLAFDLHGFVVREYLSGAR